MGWASETFPDAYTVPVGYVAVVRDADIYSGGGAMTNFEMYVDEFAKFWAGQFTIESIPQAAQWRGRQVLYPGQILVFQSDEPTDGLVSGYLLGYSS